MTTAARVRKGALALPEVEDGTHFGMVAFTVRGKNFATVTKGQRVRGGETVIARWPAAG